jgi:hypothetical protein
MTPAAADRPDAIPTAIVPSPKPSRRAPARIEAELRGLLEEGVELRPAGTAKRAPRRLLSTYPPRHRIDLFDTVFYLADVRQNDYVRFFVAYVLQGEVAWPRLFYKDVSLIWRCASHLTRLHGDWWIGKGETYTYEDGQHEVTTSREHTTDLPLELQDGLEAVLRRAESIPEDVAALERILRRRPDGHLEPYRDFLEPRRRAHANPKNLVNGGRPVARFTRRHDPTSLRFARGFEPDFRDGLLETSASRSRLYGGMLRRYRILSRNRRIQYLFMAGPDHAWILPPQATTTELSSYGVRTVGVEADEDLFVPGFEYHFEHEEGFHTQIPHGFAGEPSEVDPHRADASAWLDRLPVIREFRRRVRGAHAPRPAFGR